MQQLASPHPIIVENAKQHTWHCCKDKAQPPYGSKSGNCKFCTCRCTVIYRHALQGSQVLSSTDHDCICKYLKDTKHTCFTGLLVSAQAWAIDLAKSGFIGKYLWTPFHTEEKASDHTACHCWRIKGSINNIMETAGTLPIFKITTLNASTI